MPKTTQAAKLIATHIRKGANPAESAELLDELLQSHSGDNLAHALHYNGYATAASAERIAHAVEIERVDELVLRVADALPFPVTVDADMGGAFALQIHLGSRAGGAAPDRAGIDPHEAGATWWIETNAGEQFEDSSLGRAAAPVDVATWLTERATALGCPAAHAALQSA